MIDPHVHLRDWDEADSETLAHGLSMAWRAGLSAAFEMPNTSPPLTSAAALRLRMEQADAALEGIGVPLRHAMFAGVTADPDQVREVTTAYRALFPRVIGLKLYAGSTTGELGVTHTPGQLQIWHTLAAEGYRGVVAVHAEREDLFRPDAWDPDRLSSHGEVRPPLAEVAAVQTQLALAEAAGFRGHLHFCHVSVADTVSLVRGEAGGLPFTVSLAATPHHLLLASHTHGTDSVSGWKVNPPLRDETHRNALRDALLRGDIDWIESDHAPHTIADIRAGASGLPGIPGYRLLVEMLLAEPGIGEDRVRELSCTNVCTTFGIDPEDLPINAHSPLEAGREPSARPPSSEYRPMAAEYAIDPYQTLDPSRGFPAGGPLGYAQAQP